MTTAVTLVTARWPLQPLLDVSRLGRGNLAAHVGVSGSTLKRAARRGLSDHDADRWAVTLGFHPTEVWGWAWIDAALTDVPDESRRAAS